MSPIIPSLLLPPSSLPREQWLAELHNLAARDLSATRRVAMLDILWHQPFITREGLMWRLRYLLWLDCWGDAPQAAFRRDLSAAREWLKTQGHRLCYSRHKGQSGYYIASRAQLDEHLKRMIEFSMREVDPAQIKIYRQLEPGYRVWQAARLSDWLRQANQFRIQEQKKRYESTTSKRSD